MSIHMMPSHLTTSELQHVLLHYGFTVLFLFVVEKQTQSLSLCLLLVLPSCASRDKAWGRGRDMWHVRVQMVQRMCTWDVLPFVTTERIQDIFLFGSSSRVWTVEGWNPTFRDQTSHPTVYDADDDDDPLSRTTMLMNGFILYSQDTYWQWGRCPTGRGPLQRPGRRFSETHNLKWGKKKKRMKYYT